MNNNTYVLITAARNEEAYIESTIKSVLSQTILPVKWVIVSDASTDRTDDIVRQYTKSHNFLQFLRLDGKNRRANFASKVHAISIGYEKLKDLSSSFVGNLDGDISFGQDYYLKILKKFHENEKLGIAGGFTYEESHGQLVSRSNDVGYVSGAIQFFRRECYEAIGGYVPISVGGEDTVAAISARMKGWEVRAFPELKVLHHQTGSNKRGALRESFREGSMFFALGSHPLFEIVKSFRRIRRSPIFISALVRLTGFFWQYCRRQDRVVDRKFVEFLRKDQFKRIKALFT